VFAAWADRLVVHIRRSGKRARISTFQVDKPEKFTISDSRIQAVPPNAIVGLSSRHSKLARLVGSNRGNPCSICQVRRDLTQVLTPFDGRLAFTILCCGVLGLCLNRVTTLQPSSH